MSEHTEKSHSHIPKHIAIIPDGNRRWGRAHGIIPHEGLREGVKRFYEAAEEAFKAGVEYVTFWASSEDNFVKRSAIEVQFLIALAKHESNDGDLINNAIKNETRMRIIGWWHEVLKDKELETAIRNIERKTHHFIKHHLTLLFGYDGKREMTEAIKKIAKESPANITNETVKNALWTHDLPPVDLVIRTGGEPHWSAGFMMWLTSDSQFYFTDLLWPDFDKKEFHKSLEDYSSRDRRFGK